MSTIGEIYNRLKIDKGKQGDTSTTSSDLPLDHKVTFNRDAGEQWTYRDGHIYINDNDVEELIDGNHHNIDLQCRISEALSDYRNEVYGRRDHRYSSLANRIGSIQNTILSNLKRVYDEKIGGIYVSWGEDEFIINNVNIKVFLSMYRLRPTNKARSFLKGIKAKLALLLINKTGSPHYERIQDLIQFWHDEVNDAMGIAPIDLPALPAAVGFDRR